MDDFTNNITNNSKETSIFGEKIGSYVKSQKWGNDPIIVCLHGDLGSGKTTFVQGFARAFGIKERLLSPTFIIVRRYKLDNKLTYFYHIDLYRLHDARDFASIGITELFHESGSCILIEWPEKLESQLPSKRIDVYFQYMDVDRRKIELKFPSNI